MTMETVRAVTRAIDAFRDEAVETLAGCETRADAARGGRRRDDARERGGEKVERGDGVHSRERGGGDGEGEGIDVGRGRWVKVT